MLATAFILFYLFIYLRCGEDFFFVIVVCREDYQRVNTALCFKAIVTMIALFTCFRLFGVVQAKFHYNVLVQLFYRLVRRYIFGFLLGHS